MELAKSFILLIIGVCVIIRPQAILSTRFKRTKEPIIQEETYDKSTLRLWRAAGIGITIIAIYFLLKNFKVF
jgi:hypothetical protein